MDNKDINTQSLGVPDDVDVLIQLKDWLFALEGPQEISDRWKFCPPEDASREDRCWHTCFQNMIVKAKSRMNYTNGERKYIGEQKYPIELVTVRICSTYLSCCMLASVCCTMEIIVKGSNLTFLTNFVVFFFLFFKSPKIELKRQFKTFWLTSILLRKYNNLGS